MDHHSPPPPRLPALPLIDALCTALTEHDVDVCHWKSNDALARSADGRNDLDLLVRRRDVTRFRAVLAELGFKRARVPVAETLPGIEDFLGWDPSSDRLVHVHAHYQLVVGHDRSKNVRLPIEEAFLDSAEPAPPFRIPAPEFDLIVFVVRMVLKFQTWDAPLAGPRHLPDSARRELAWLRERADPERVRALLGDHLPWLPPELFERCLAELESERPRRLATSGALLQVLAPHARRGPLHDLAVKGLGRSLRGSRRRLRGGVGRKRLAHGGALLAIVGGDGAGKSTAIEGLEAWLGTTLEVVRVHLGRPPWSRTTRVARALLKLGRIVSAPFGVPQPVLTDNGLVPEDFPGYTRLLWGACTARDRRLAYARARRLATEGAIVICDRYPLPQLRTMEGRLVDQMLETGPDNALTRWLRRLEQRSYDAIAPPELLAVLRIDPDLAVRRKPEDDADFVRVRSSEVWNQGWETSRAHVLDASQPAEKVLDELKAWVWASL